MLTEPSLRPPSQSRPHLDTHRVDLCEDIGAHWAAVQCRPWLRDGVGGL